MGDSIHSSTPDFPDAMDLWHNNAKLEVTPTAAISSSASAPGSENCSRKIKTTEHSPIVNLRIHASKQPHQDHGAARTASQSCPVGPFPETAQSWSWTLSLLSFLISIPMAPPAGVSSLLADCSHPVRTPGLLFPADLIPPSCLALCPPFRSQPSSYARCHRFLHMRCLAPYFPLPQNIDDKCPQVTSQQPYCASMLLRKLSLFCKTSQNMAYVATITFLSVLS